MKKVLLTAVFVTSCIAATAQWNSNPTENNRITPAQMRIYDWEVEASQNGYTYIMFNRPTNGNTATCLQILDKDGKMLFPEEGKMISGEETLSFTMINDYMMIDKDNNAIIAVSDCRNSAPGVNALSYTIYKVSPTGEMLWGDKGIDMEEGRSGKLRAAMKMVQLESGSYVFAWMRKDREEPMQIQMQCLSENGEFLWDDVALRDDVINYEHPYLVNAGNNQVNLVYVKGSGKELMARKIDFDGSSVWSQDTRIYRGGFGDVPLQVVLNVAHDPNGGVFVGWYDDRLFINKESTYVSYVKPNGTLAFAEGEDGLKVGNSELRGFSPEMNYDKSNNSLYVIWRETSAAQGFQRLMAQKVAMTGELIWGPDGTEVAPLSRSAVGYYNIEAATDGKFAAFYMLRDSVQTGYGKVKAYASLINGNDGQAIWGFPNAVFANNDSEKGSLMSSPLIDNNFWVAVWSDERIFNTVAEDKEGNDALLYAQRINMDGSLGKGTSIESTQVERVFAATPSVIEESTQFIVDNEKSGLADLSIYSLSGQKMAVAYHGQLDKGVHEITWNVAAQVSSGAYIATLTTATGSKSVRIIVK